MRTTKPRPTYKARLNWQPAKSVHVIGSPKDGHLWIGAYEEEGRDYYGSISLRRLLRLLHRAGVIDLG